MINSPEAANLNCPMDCRWTNTRDQEVQIAQEVMVITGKEEGCCNLSPHRILSATSNNVQVQYAFYSFGKRVQA